MSQTTETATATGSALHLLVVDDTQALRKHIAELLRRQCGAQVTEAENGVQALRELREKVFALMVTDVNMPLLDGLKLTTLVRQDEQHKDMPILVMTTEASPENRSKALAMGASSFVEKPASDLEVVQQVQKLLQRKRRGPSS